MIRSWLPRRSVASAFRSRGSRWRGQFLPALEQLEARQMLTVYTVDLPGDANPTGGGVPDVPGGLSGDFRYCLSQAQINDAPGTNEIDFNLGGGGPQTITLNAALPNFFNSLTVVINGTTQPGYAGTPLITLDGSKAGSTGGLVLSSFDTVEGLAIRNFAGNGVTVLGDNDNLLNNVIANNGGDGIQIGILVGDRFSFPFNNVVQGNTITANQGDGVAVLIGNGNTILSNSIFANGGLGINLEGYTGLDPVQPDDINPNNPNFFQNYPVLTSGTLTSTATTIAGNLQSATDGTYTIEFFANPTADPKGLGQGQIFLGSTTVTTNAVGTANFSVSFAPLAFGPSWVVSATATDITPSSDGPANNTSELSPELALTIVVPPTPPTPPTPVPPTDTNPGAGIPVQSLEPPSVIVPPVTTLAPAAAGSQTPPNIYVPSFVILAAVPPQADYILFPTSYIGNVSVIIPFSEFESGRTTSTVTITGVAFEDTNGSGIRDSEEPGLEGMTFYLARDRDDPFDHSKPTAVTNAKGEFRFIGLLPGKYVIQPVPNRRYRITEPDEGIYEVLLRADQSVSVVFGFRPVRPRARPRPTPTPTPPPSPTGALPLSGIKRTDWAEADHQVRDACFRDYGADWAGLDLEPLSQVKIDRGPCVPQMALLGLAFAAARDWDSERRSIAPLR